MGQSSDIWRGERQIWKCLQEVCGNLLSVLISTDLKGKELDWYSLNLSAILNDNIRLMGDKVNSELP